MKFQRNFVLSGLLSNRDDIGMATAFRDQIAQKVNSHEVLKITIDGEE
jgi:hypothetical protein